MKLTKKVITIALTAAVSLSAFTAVSASASAEWVKSSSGYSYKDDSTGKKLTGWQTINGGKYYFNKNGIATTGKAKIGGKTYYFDAGKKGKMLTSWAKIGGKYYYFGSDGAMRTGWVKIGDKQYYFNTDGTMLAGNTYKINGKSYTFGTDGVLKSSGSTSSKSTSSKGSSKLSWGMSEEDALKKLGNDKVLYMSPIIIDYKTDPYSYYLFDGSMGLCIKGSMAAYSASQLSGFKKNLTDNGWKYNAKYSENGSTALIYTKTVSKGQVSYAAIAYNAENCISMEFSPELGSMVESGEIDSIMDIM